MNIHIESSKPTIYADINVFRYLTRGEITIKDADRFIWVYSKTHLSEIFSNFNQETLNGMRLLHAVEIFDSLNEQCQPTGQMFLKNYIDPSERYNEYLNDFSNFDGIYDLPLEQQARLYGADNLDQLSKSPKKHLDYFTRLANSTIHPYSEYIIKTGEDLLNIISTNIENQTNLQNRTSINTTRNQLGMTSENRKIIENSSSPIDEIWNFVQPILRKDNVNLTKKQFFLLDSIPGTELPKPTQFSAIVGLQAMLNLYGIYPDEKLKDVKKIKNCNFDAAHTGIASYCNALLSADTKLIKKADCIYKFLGNTTNAVHFEYSDGYVLDLGIIRD